VGRSSAPESQAPTRLASAWHPQALVHRNWPSTTLSSWTLPLPIALYRKMCSSVIFSDPTWFQSPLLVRFLSRLPDLISCSLQDLDPVWMRGLSGLPPLAGLRERAVSSAHRQVQCEQFYVHRQCRLLKGCMHSGVAGCASRNHIDDIFDCVQRARFSCSITALNLRGNPSYSRGNPTRV
jgi:hypothetical protein